MTPEYLREARAYLSLTHQAQEPASPQNPRSPGISSPILSSTGLAMGERGRRREVRFEENIMSESAWDRQSTSSDSSLDPPVVLPRPGTGGLRMNGMSSLSISHVNYPISCPMQVLVNCPGFPLSDVRLGGGPTATQLMHPLTDITDGRTVCPRRHTTAGPVIKITAKNRRRLHVVTCFVTSTCYRE